MNTDNHLDLLLRALADRTRRTLLDRLRDEPGLTLSALLEGFPQSRQALSKHLAMLEDAELVVPVWRGREKHHYLNPAPLQNLPARWLTASTRQDQAASEALREALAAPLPDHAEPPQAPPARAAAPARSRRASRAADPIAALLLQPPPARLQGQPVMLPEALAAACGYLAQSAEAVAALLAAMAPEQGYDKPAGGGFSLVEHLWHLADIETLGWRVRFQRIRDELRPRLPGVDGDRLAAERQYQAQPWRAAARRFVAERRRTLATLAAYDADLLRRAVVFGGVRARAGGVVAAMVAHDADHRPEMAERWAAMRAG